MVDTDRFKQMNDRHAHEAGDRLPRQIGEALSSALRDDVDVGCLGGDEFRAPRHRRRGGADCWRRVSARVRSQEIKGLAEFGLPSVSLGIAQSEPLDGAKG